MSLISSSRGRQQGAMVIVNVVLETSVPFLTNTWGGVPHTALGFSFNNLWLLRFALSTYVGYFRLKYTLYITYIITQIIHKYIHICIYLAYQVVGFPMASSYTLVELWIYILYIYSVVICPLIKEYNYKHNGDQFYSTCWFQSKKFSTKRTHP